VAIRFLRKTLLHGVGQSVTYLLTYLLTYLRIYFLN